MSAITDLSASELSAAIHAKTVSCVEVMQAYLTRIHALNPQYNAIVSIQPDELLLTHAAQKDALLARGESQGWLHGIPQAPKDLSATAGIATTMGFRGLAKHIPSADSIMVARLRSAGAIFIGKTNTPEFGLGSHTFNNVFGTTANAYDASKSAGGSSGGAAVALAARLLPVADGSDMMGSLRNPAAWNNIYGLRPSLGRVPYGATDLDGNVVGDVFFQQLGTEGPMARTVEDLARLLATQSGYDARVPLSLRKDSTDFINQLQADLTATQPTRLAWLGDMRGHLALEPAVRQLLDAAKPSFTKLGYEVQDTSLNIDLHKVWKAWLCLRGLAVAGNLSPLANNPATRALLKADAIWEYEQGSQYRAQDVYQASAVRSQLYAVFMQLFRGVDYIALPAAQCMPFDKTMVHPTHIDGRAMDTYHRWMECTIYATLAGLPAIVLPVGFSAEGLPMGIQIIGKPRQELSLLQLAKRWEGAAPSAIFKPAMN